jgi:4-amino-4-deoxy-L-arabinose transferase-like glycosyltransferase
MLLTSHLFCKQGRFAITDMVLLLFLTSSFLCFVLGYGVGKATPNRRWYLVMYLLWGMATMQKGPAVGLVLPMLVILVFLWSSSELYRLKEVMHPWGIALYFIIVLPWPLVVGKEYLNAFLWDNNVKRFTSNPSWKSSPFFYFGNLPFQFMPWSPFLILLASAARKLKREFETKTSLLWCWFAVVFVIFSMSDTKRSSYILPLYPALAILVAWGIQMLSWHRKELIQYWKISMVLLGFGLIGVCAGITFLWWGHIPTEVTGVALGLFGASLGFPLLLHLLAKEKNTNVVIMLLSMVALGYSIGYTGWYQPVYDRYYRSPKHYIEPMKKLVNNSPLLHIGSIRSHDLFYFNRNEMPAWNPKRGLKVLKNGYLLSRRENLNNLRARPGSGLTPIFEIDYRGMRMVLLRGGDGI